MTTTYGAWPNLKTSHISLDSIKKSITCTMIKLDPMEVARPVKDSRRHVERVIDAGGGHIE